MTIAMKTKGGGQNPRPPDEIRSNAGIGGFEGFARAAAIAMGRPAAFFAAAGIVLAWAIAGPIFHYSDTWQLAINTGTTIVTFLMVFLIQQSQNRDALAVQIKLAELIIAMKGADNAMATAENLSEQELQALHAEFRKDADETLARLEGRRAMTVREAVKMEAEPPPEAKS
jgi:low affinity Fe/Cu permease